MALRPPAMPPADFLSCLEEAGLSCAEFAAIAGEPVDRVTRMMLGRDPVPYSLSLLATLLTLGAARELAVMHAEVYTTEGAFTEPRWLRPPPREPDESFVEIEAYVQEQPARLGPTEA